MSRFNPTGHTLPTALLILLLLGSFLAISVHVVFAGPDHHAEACVACTWFYQQFWVESGALLLIYFAAKRISVHPSLRFPCRFPFLPQGRSPPFN